MFHNPLKLIPILGVRGILNCVPDKIYLKWLYKAQTGLSLNLKDPQTYNEKLQWYKVYYHDPLMTVCADKYAVRQYVTDCGLSHILTTLYGVYESVEDVDFDCLPDECFIKCSFNSNGNYHWKSGDNKNLIIRKYKKMMSKNRCYYGGREWCYKHIVPRLVFEEYIKAESSEGFVDFNIFCFYGKPKLIMYNIEMCNPDGSHGKGRRAVFDPDFNRLDIKTNLESINDKNIVKPVNFHEMLAYAEILSKPFPHVRIDFFYIDGDIRFGEMTFYSGSGFGKYEPREFQYTMGSWFPLPKTKLN